MNKFSAMELIEIMDKLEGVEPVRRYIAHKDDDNNINDMIDQLFFRAFGLDWDKIFKEVRNNILLLMDLIQRQDGYYMLISK